MTTEESIFLGVISGVLAATTVYIIKEFWFKILLPWHQGIRYGGADISGSWFADSKNNLENMRSIYSVVLKQSAHTVTGSMQFTYESEDRKFNIDYTLSGEYWEGYLNLTCRSKDRKIYSHGSMFLKLINNGSGLLGQFSFRHAYQDIVVTMPIGIDRN